jgi:hypothetical protein
LPPAAPKLALVPSIRIRPHCNRLVPHASRLLRSIFRPSSQSKPTAPLVTPWHDPAQPPLQIPIVPAAPPGACGTAVAPPPDAISCLGAFRTPVGGAPGEIVVAGVRKPCMGPSKSSTYFTAFSTFFFFPVSLFDLEARFFVPTHRVLDARRAQEAVKAGRRSASASRSVVSRPRLDSLEHGGTLAMVGMTCPRGARCRARSSIAPQPCIRSIREDRTMMQSCASVAKLRGGGSILHSGLESHGFTSDHRHLGSSSADPGMGRQAVVLVSFLFNVVGYDAGRKTMPSDTSPVVTRRQRAMSSFRANATIIVLRVLPRPSAVRV